MNIVLPLQRKFAMCCSLLYLYHNEFRQMHHTMVLRNNTDPQLSHFVLQVSI